MPKTNPDYTLIAKHGKRGDNNRDSDCDDHKHIDKKLELDEEDSTLTTCGFGRWRPRWLQVFATPVWFTLNFGLIGIIHGMIGTYFIGCMGDLEKRFAFDSKISGVILIADNVVQILVSSLVGYLGDRHNRPMMIMIGELILALSCAINAAPYFIYGAGTHLLHDDKLLSTTSLMNSTKQYEMCTSVNSTMSNLDECTPGSHSTIWPAVITLIIGSAFRGIGYTTYWVIGVPFLDDSVTKDSSPVYMSLASVFRLIGPFGGLFLSAFTLRYYENPFYNPGIGRRDPRFIGAWWVGFLMIGVALFLVSLPMCLFPTQLKSASVKVNRKSRGNGFKAMWPVFKRLAKNAVFMFHTFGGVFRYMGLAGYTISQTKYVRAQFHLSSSRASLVTGVTSIFPLVFGIVLGGYGIKWFKPRPLTLVLLMFAVEWFANGGIFTAMFMDCPAVQLPTQLTTADNKFTLNATCNQGCECPTKVFTPMCSLADRVTTYFSPCFAGCQTLNRTGKMVSDCSCIEQGGSATMGYCPNYYEPCSNLIIYMSVLIIGSLVSSLALAGNTILPLRVIDPGDKSFAMGMIGTIMAVFAFIPYPLIFGAVIDSTCLVWKSQCGKRGNCLIYDQDKFRYYLHGTSLTLLLIGTLLDLGIIYYAKTIKNFYDDPNGDDVRDGKSRGDEYNMISLTSVALKSNRADGVTDDNDNKITNLDKIK